RGPGHSDLTDEPSSMCPSSWRCHRLDGVIALTVSLPKRYHHPSGITTPPKSVVQRCPSPATLPRRSRWAGDGRRLSKPPQLLCAGGVRGRACLSTKSVRGTDFCEFAPDPGAKRLQGNPEGA